MAAVPAHPWGLREKRGPALRQKRCPHRHGTQLRVCEPPQLPATARHHTPDLQTSRDASLVIGPGKATRLPAGEAWKCPGTPTRQRMRLTARSWLAGRLKAGLQAASSGSGSRRHGSLAVPSALGSHCPHSVPLLLTRDHKGIYFPGLFWGPDCSKHFEQLPDTAQAHGPALFITKLC